MDFGAQSHFAGWSRHWTDINPLWDIGEAIERERLFTEHVGVDPVFDST